LSFFYGSEDSRRGLLGAVMLCSIVVGYNVSEVHAASIFTLKQWYPTTTLHGFIAQKTSTWVSNHF